MKFGAILLLAVTLAGCSRQEVGGDSVTKRHEVPPSAVVESLPALPRPVTNNAVARIESEGRESVFSFMGIGASKSWDAIVRDAYVLEVESGRWEPIPSVPGDHGRIAATAQGVGQKVYLIGGYEVAEDGSEVSVPNVDIYDAAARSWSRGADMPVPVDDSVSGVYRNRYVFVISGWSMADNVDDVQVYDTVDDVWIGATPIPGTPVFGHAGALLDDAIVYCDGAYRNEEGKTPRYVASSECWLGQIDPETLTRIDWTAIPSHPGTARYRIAAGASSDDRRVWFVGGTANPYNIDGFGYDGNPSEPVGTTFAWDLEQSEWIEGVDLKVPTMDHRGLIETSRGMLRVGGMKRGQEPASETFDFGRVVRRDPSH